MSAYHTPVLLSESLGQLVTNKSGIYMDATFGGGGHTTALLSRLQKGGKVIAFDRDIDALRTVPDDPRLTLVHADFRFVENFAHFLGAGPVDGILADLGVSSHQFDTAERGFSFRFDSPLDMRMNTLADRTAADVLAESDAAALERILRIYGEVDGAGKMAALIIKARALAPLRTTAELNAALAPLLPKAAPHKVLAKVYQALRIEVNRELRSLEKFLAGCSAIIRPGGRLAVITYHSLEDRMVKNFIKSGNVGGEVVKDAFGKVLAPFEAVLRKPIVPSEEEIRSNTRARSAKLRVAQRTEDCPC